MGFFSEIGDFFSGIAEGISNFCKGAIEVINTIGWDKIASVVTSIAAIAIPGVGLPEILAILSIAAVVIGGLAKVLGLNDNDKEPEEIGFASEVADMKPEDFDNMADYNKYLSSYTLSDEDKERFDSLSEEERNKYKLTGYGIQVAGVEDELGIKNLSDAIATLSKAKNNGAEITEDDISKCVMAAKENGITDMKDISNYLQNKPTTESKGVIGDALTSALSEKYPEMSADDIAGKIGDIAANSIK